MRHRQLGLSVAAVLLLSAGGPTLAQESRSLTVRPRHHAGPSGDNVRTPATPNVPIAAEADDSPDGPLAHGNCSTAGGGTGEAVMGRSNC